MTNETTIAGPSTADTGVAEDTASNPTTSPAGPASFEMIASSYDTVVAELHTRQAAALARLKPILFKTLRDAGIDVVKVTFDGEGDSGQIDETIAYRGEQVVDLPTEPLTWSFVRMEAKFLPCDVNPSGRKFAGYEVEDTEETAPITDIIASIFWTLIGETHGGWENNDGGFGACSFLVEDEIIRLAMHERYTETTYSEHEW